MINECKIWKKKKEYKKYIKSIKKSDKGSLFLRWKKLKVESVEFIYSWILGFFLIWALIIERESVLFSILGGFVYAWLIYIFEQRNLTILYYNVKELYIDSLNKSIIKTSKRFYILYKIIIIILLLIIIILLLFYIDLNYGVVNPENIDNLLKNKIKLNIDLKSLKEYMINIESLNLIFLNLKKLILELIIIFWLFYDLLIYIIMISSLDIIINNTLFIILEFWNNKVILLFWNGGLLEDWIQEFVVFFKTYFHLNLPSLKINHSLEYKSIIIQNIKTSFNILILSKISVLIGLFWYFFGLVKMKILILKISIFIFIMTIWTLIIFQNLKNHNYEGYIIKRKIVNNKYIFSLMNSNLKFGEYVYHKLLNINEKKKFIKVKYIWNLLWLKKWKKKD